MDPWLRLQNERDEQAVTFSREFGHRRTFYKKLAVVPQQLCKRFTDPLQGGKVPPNLSCLSTLVPNSLPGRSRRYGFGVCKYLVFESLAPKIKKRKQGPDCMIADECSPYKIKRKFENLGTLFLQFK